MSAREDPDTIPPPAGEDDAYSATTKVGAMPAELMAKLRAEGLLPPEDEEKKMVSSSLSKPSSAFAPPPSPRLPPPQLPLMPPPSEPDFEEYIPSLYSSVPPPPSSLGPGMRPSTSEGSTAPLASPPPRPVGDASHPAIETETPAAFEALPADAADPADAQSLVGVASESDIEAFGHRSRNRMIAVVVAGLVAVVVFAFVMALMSQHR